MTNLPFYRSLVVLNGAVPLLVLGWDATQNQLGANSANYALHITGILSLIFLFLSLTMTPLHWWTGWGGWIGLRRALGLYGFFYALLHGVIYVVFDRAFNLTSTLTELATRRYLQVGGVALLLMVPLAVTSTNAMIDKLGPRRWKRLHRLAYLATALGVVHYYMLVKSDVRQPLAFAGVLASLLGVRLWHTYWTTNQGARRKPHVKDRTNAQVAPGKGSTSKPAAFWRGSLRVAAIFQETHDVKTFRLASPDGGPLPFAYMPGQYMNLQLSIDGQEIKRSYTIASSPTRSGFCELTIKREPLGTASRFIHDHWKVGDAIRLSAPAGRFVFTGAEASSVLLIAGGVGITPLMSILRYLTDRAWRGEVYLLIVAKTERDLIFRDELEWLGRRFPNLHLCVSLTRSDAPTFWNGQRGRATSELLKRFVPDLPNVPVYLCGPEGMMEATRTLLIESGVPSSEIRTEAFVSPTDATPSSPFDTPQSITNDATFAVTFAKSSVETIATNEFSLLEVAEEASVDLPFECRSGICGQCKTRLLSGSVVMESETALSPADKRKGFVLACQAHARSNLVVDA